MPDVLGVVYTFSVPTVRAGRGEVAMKGMPEGD